MIETDNSPHLLLLLGVGGYPPKDAIESVATVTNRVSVVFIDAWVSDVTVRRLWDDAKLDGELIISGSFDQALDAVGELHRKQPLDGVVTYSELLLLLHTRVAEKFGLPGSPLHSIHAAQSKAQQRSIFAAKGVASPRYVVISDATGIPEAISQVGLPAVFKPSLGAGSVGVRVVSTAAEVESAFRESVCGNSVFLQEDTNVLLEEYLPISGAEGSRFANYFSVESLIFNGKVTHLAVTDRTQLTHGCVEEGLILPSQIPQEQQDLLKRESERAITALGLTHGAAHTEIALVPDGPRVIEVNARAGGPLPSMFKAAAGYDYAADIARVYLGITPLALPTFNSVAWHRFVPIPDGEWTIASQTPAEQVLRQVPSLVYLSTRFAEGQDVSRAMTLHLASFMLTAPDVDEAYNLVKDVERMLDIKLQRTVGHNS